MKKLNIRSIITAGIVVFGGVSMMQCDQEVIPWPAKSTDLVITDYVYSQEEDFAEFGIALEYTGIENLLRVRGPFTLFLPTDAAMQDYYSSKGVAGAQDIELETMKDFVYNHILQGEISAGAIGLGTLPYQNGLGDFIASDFAGIEILLNKEAIIIDRDIPTSNGYVHHIDHVLEPVNKTVIDVLRDLGGFNIFIEGLELTGIADTLEIIEFPFGQTTARTRFTILAVPDSVYSKEGITTIDALIEAYTEEDNYTSSDNEFNQYIDYHCVSGTYYFSDFNPDDNIYYTLSGNNYLSIDVEDDFKINKSDTSYIGFNYELSNYPAKNGAVHTVNTILPNTETELREIVHQVTDYFDLKQGAYFGQYYERFYDGQNTFEGIKWEAEFLQYYYKINHNLWDDDALNLNGHFWIEITTPKIRAGNYTITTFAFYGDNAICSVFLDDVYIGVFNPNDESWGGPPVYIGEASFDETATHRIRFQTTKPGQLFWDRLHFVPIE